MRVYAEDFCDFLTLSAFVRIGPRTALRRAIAACGSSPRRLNQRHNHKGRNMSDKADEKVVETKKLRKTGNSSGVTLSRKVLAAAGFAAGEDVTVTATPGKIIVSQAGGIYARTRAAGRACLEQYRYALEVLGS